MENLLTDEQLLSLAILAVFMFLFAYKIYNRQSGLKSMEKLLNDYYAEKGFEILSISKLKTADKIKYGVPLQPYFSMYSSPFQIFKALDENYHRLVETKDSSGKEHLRYVEVKFILGKGMTVNEFDCYEF